MVWLMIFFYRYNIPFKLNLYNIFLQKYASSYLSKRSSSHEVMPPCLLTCSLICSLVIFHSFNLLWTILSFIKLCISLYVFSISINILILHLPTNCIFIYFITLLVAVGLIGRSFQCRQRPWH
jgi:hypothetical protein